MDISLQNLFADVPAKIEGGKGITVRGICIDSRRATPGSIFFALGGQRTDGNFYAEEAVDRGAVAIVSDRPGHPIGGAAYIRVTGDIRVALAEVARCFYRFPERALELVGVTGTNGKTTVAYLVRHLLGEATAPCGMIGTVEYSIGKRTLPAYRTTPESVDAYALLAQMRDAGCRSAVMEVSSHGIDQRRIHGLEFEVAAFLNLTRDHIDYHETVERYFGVKSRLFSGETGSVPKMAVINFDDPYGHRLLHLTASDTGVITFGEAEDALLRAENIRLGPDGSTFDVLWQGECHTVETSLLGRYNVSNLLAALSIGLAMGHALAGLIERLPSFPGVPGRMERVDRGQSFNVLVDYAHTDDALKNALDMLRAVTPGRILTVFGCGGNRDRAKRPMMTRAAIERSDICWATADNPRGESVEAIFEDMRTGVEPTDADRIHFIEDRRWAINKAIEAAEPGDCVLIAGKGHEAFQEFAGAVVPFDDRQAARELLDVKRLRNGAE